MRLVLQNDHPGCGEWIREKHSWREGGRKSSEEAALVVVDTTGPVYVSSLPVSGALAGSGRKSCASNISERSNWQGLGLTGIWELRKRQT